MTDTMESQNIDISSWDSLYIWCDMQIASCVPETNCHEPFYYVQYSLQKLSADQ